MYSASVQGFPIWNTWCKWKTIYFLTASFQIKPIISVQKIHSLGEFGEIPSMDSNQSVHFLPWQESTIQYVYKYPGRKFKKGGQNSTVYTISFLREMGWTNEFMLAWSLFLKRINWIGVWACAKTTISPLEAPKSNMAPGKCTRKSAKMLNLFQKCWILFLVAKSIVYQPV